MMEGETVLEELDPEEEGYGEEYSSDGGEVVEELLDVGDTIVEEYSEEYPLQASPFSFRMDIDYKNLDGFERYFERYEAVYREVRERLEGLEFDEDDVESFILRAPTTDSDREKGKLEQELLGMYTGALSELLTERQDGTTRIHVNGGGREFDKLFSCAREVDELVVENFRGRGILQAVGQQGRAEMVVARGIQGGNCCYAVGMRGEVGSVYLDGVEGEGAGQHIGGGTERSVSLPNEAEVRFPREDASVETVVMHDVTGAVAGKAIGSRGSVGTVMLVDVEGSRVADRMGTDRTVLSPVRRNVDTVVAYDVEGRNPLNEVQAWDILSNGRTGREIDEGLEELLESLRDGVTVEKVDAVEEYIEENRGTLDRFKGGYT